MINVNVMAQEKIVQTAGHDQLGGFAPKFAELNDDVLFGEVWSRTDKLGLRDRSLVTITSLISQGITDSSLIYHLQSAKNNGITRTEIAEIITHIGFYAGWPPAWAARASTRRCSSSSPISASTTTPASPASHSNQTATASGRCSTPLTAFQSPIRDSTSITSRTARPIPASPRPL